jgi:hypothetical protein
LKDQKPDFPPFEPKESSQMKNYDFFHKKWPLHLLTTTAFLLPLFSSGTRSATLFLDKTMFLRTFLWQLSFLLLAHPDARWLTSACAGMDVSTKEDAKRVFSALGQNDARALCFAWLLGDRQDLTSLRRSAELGFAFAQARLAGKTQGEESSSLLSWLLLKENVTDLYWLGLCFRNARRV